MIKYGTNNIGKIYFGSNLIGKAYLGSNLVYQSGSSPGPSPTPTETQVQYLLTSGEQYFDTAIQPTNDLDFECDIELLSSGGGACIFGARNRTMAQTQTKPYNTLSVYANGDGYLALNDINYDSGYLTGKPSILNTRCMVKVTSRSLYVDNTLYVASGQTATYAINTTVGFLRMHGLNDTWQSGTNRAISAKIYGLKIYKSSVLVCNLLPYKDVYGAGYLYDTVTQTKIYNIGSGSVTPGPEVNNS